MDYMEYFCASSNWIDWFGSKTMLWWPFGRMTCELGICCTWSTSLMSPSSSTLHCSNSRGSISSDLTESSSGFSAMSCIDFGRLRETRDLSRSFFALSRSTTDGGVFRLPFDPSPFELLTFLVPRAD